MKNVRAIVILSAYICLATISSTSHTVAAVPRVAGVMGSFSWAGGYAQPILMSMQVSATNKNTLTTLLHTAMSNTDVEFMFDIYEYDPVARAYYKCAHSNSVILRGLIQRSGGELAAAIDPDPSGEVPSPANYTFTIGVMPQELSQEIHLAVSAAAPYVKQWGVTVGAKMAQIAKTAAEVSIVCSVPQGFNFHKDEQMTVGFVTSMKIGTTTLAADIVVTDMNEAMPVELQAFSAAIVRGKAELHWSTAAEVNNQGFEVEKNVDASWNTIGYVEGAGTTHAPRHYLFVDAHARGRISYRLKQIDRDGRFTYSRSVDVCGALAAEDFTLSQNYPNPFNPATTITFAVKNAGHVEVTVYNSLGRAVATLFNGVADPNELYALRFDAKGLPSGTYFYSLRSASRSEVKAMSVLK